MYFSSYINHFNKIIRHPSARFLGSIMLCLSRNVFLLLLFIDYQIDKTFVYFPPLADCTVLSDTVEARSQEGGIQIRSISDHLNPGT